MKDLPKNSAGIALGKWKIYGPNDQELVGLKKEIFGESIYYVDMPTSSPRIIDGGAHVGLATFYFKSLWPKAKITCIEPLPQNITYLAYNLWLNHIDDVEYQEVALAKSAGERTLYFDQSGDDWYSTAGFEEGAWNHLQQSQSVNVKTTTLDSLIHEEIDLLKLDIEGAEEEVICHSQRLHHIKNIIIELHPPTQGESSASYEKLSKHLKNHHFTVALEKTHFGLSRLTAHHLP